MNNITISVVIPTYNFEKIILECLESLESELKDIYEIIISDDCSTDKTLELCSQWKNKLENKANITILESNLNEGVVKNINKGCKIAKGEWIKLLAGDDILIKDSMKSIKEFIQANKGAKVICSRVIPFYKNKQECIYLKSLPQNKNFYFNSPQKQLKELLENNCIVAPGVIIKNSLLKEMCYFDEKFKMVEDYPFWIKLLKNNIKFYFLDKEIVLYRQSENSVSGKMNGQKVNKNILEFEKEFYKKIYINEVKNPLKKWDRYIEIRRKEIIFKSGNKSNIWTQLMRWLQTKNLLKYIFRIIIILIIIKLLFFR